ncbi:P-loop containing nucleoside triphosphate hydrolase protein, partial [Ephemerocybe angulata]
FSISTQPHVLLFADSKKLGVRITQYLNTLLPEEYRSGPKKMIYHYNSHMSEKYLAFVFTQFTSDTGNCRILVTTSCNAVGVDFPNVKIVCNAGLPSTVVDTLQRAGRAIRTGTEDALFILFYDLSVHDIALEEYSNGDQGDSDRPRTNLTMRNPNRKDRAPYFLVELIQSRRCIRASFAKYLNESRYDPRR